MDIDWGTYLPMLKTLSLPLLLFVGKWLKGLSFVRNGVIPYVTTGLNAAGWVLLTTGLASMSGGQLVPLPGLPPDPAIMGLGAAAVPLYATLAFAMPGWLGAVLGTVASVGVEQFLVNKAHKGIKYRILFKAAEKMGVIPAPQAREARRNSRW